jgi:hypothetical protein
LPRVLSKHWKLNFSVIVKHIAYANHRHTPTTPTNTLPRERATRNTQRFYETMKLVRVKMIKWTDPSEFDRRFVSRLILELNLG